MEFTKEEIEAAEAVKKQMMDRETPDTLKAIYMAGEICMYEEMKVKNISSNSCVSGSLAYDKLFKHLTEEHNLILTETEMNDIKYILLGKEEYLRQANDR